MALSTVDTLAAEDEKTARPRKGDRLVFAYGERAGQVIGPEDLPDMIRFGESHRGSLIIDSPTLTLEELEKEYILKVLTFTRWQKKKASEVLGINASTLYRKLSRYGVEGAA